MKLTKLHLNIIVLLFFASSINTYSFNKIDYVPENLNQAIININRHLMMTTKVSMIQKSYPEFRNSKEYDCIINEIVSKWCSPASSCITLMKDLERYVESQNTVDFMMFILWHQGRSCIVEFNEPTSELINLYKSISNPSNSSVSRNLKYASIVEIPKPNETNEIKCSTLWAPNDVSSAALLYPYTSNESMIQLERAGSFNRIEPLMVVTNGKKVGILNSQIELIAPLKFNRIETCFGDEFAVLETITNEKSKFSLADRKTIQVEDMEDFDVYGENFNDYYNRLPTWMRYGQYLNSEDTAKRVGLLTHIKIKKNNKWTLYKSIKGELKQTVFKNIIPLTPKDTLFLVLNTPFIRTTKPKCGYISWSGKETIPFIYESGSEFYNGYAIVKLNDKRGVINTKGKVVIPFKYQTIEFNASALYNNKHLFIVKENDKYNLINLNSENISRESYDNIESRFNRISKKDYFIIQKDKKNGVADMEGKIIVPIIYDLINLSEFGELEECYTKIGDKSETINLK